MLRIDENGDGSLLQKHIRPHPDLAPYSFLPLPGQMVPALVGRNLNGRSLRVHRSAAGFPGSPSASLGLVGVDQWQALQQGDEGGRQEMVYNLKVGPMKEDTIR